MDSTPTIQNLKERISHILDAVKNVEDLERNVDQSTAYDVGETQFNPATVLSAAAIVKENLYKHLAQLTTVLLQAERAAGCFSISNPKTEEEEKMLISFAQFLIGAGAGEVDGKPSKKGVVGRCGQWLKERAAVCGRELTAFSDILLAITTGLLMVKLVERCSSRNIAEIAREHRETMNDLKDLKHHSK